MKKIKTGDKSLDQWTNFFHSSKKSNTKFLKLLKKYDKYFLTVSPPHNIEELIFPENGLLEEDFRKIAFNNSVQLIEEKNRIILAVANNVNLIPWISKYKEIFFDIIEKSLIEGDYEKYGVEFEKVLKIAVDKEYIDRNEFMGIAILRGMLWSSRYDTEEKEKQLKKNIKFNKYKTLIGI